MLKELYDALRKDIVFAAEPHMSEVDLHKDFAYLDGAGVLRFVDGKPEPRSHQAYDMETIAEFVRRFDAGLDLPCAIWYSRSAVVCLINDDDRKDKVTLKLDPSEPMKKLHELQTRPFLDQKPFLTMLRTTFRGCLDQDHPTLIDQLRRVQSSQQSNSDADVQRGKSSIGKSMRAEITGAGELPEYVTLRIPVFLQEIGIGKCPVVCALEPNELANPPQFQMFPCPGELEKAFHQAEAMTAERLGELVDAENTNIYFGVP